LLERVLERVLGPVLLQAQVEQVPQQVLPPP
jgi:hypothetical protein